MIDLIAEVNPALETDPTYLWGTKRLDYILVTPGLKDAAIKAGHHPFHQHLVTDHKGIFAYFVADKIFDTGEIDGSHKSQRRLDLRKRDTVTTYIKILEGLYKHHGIVKKLLSIETKLNKVTCKAHKMALLRGLDKLDQERVQLMIAAEKKVGRAPRYGIYDWSPALEKAGRQITFWKLMYHQRRQGYVNPDRIQRLRTELKITEEVLGKQQIRARLRAAWKNLRETQKHHQQLREEHLAQLAEHYAGLRNTTQAQEVKKLLHIESVKRIASKHRWYLKGSKGMIRQLQVQNFLVTRMLPVFASFALLVYMGMGFLGKMAGERTWRAMGLYCAVWCTSVCWGDYVVFDGWKPLTDEKRIHDRLLRRNATHLSLSRNTPFATGIMAKTVGTDGENPAVDAILDGTFIWTGTTGNPLLDSSEMKEFLKALKRPLSQSTGRPIPTLDTVITDEEYKTMFNKTREDTASHPPIHYGHYKAACESAMLVQVNKTFMNLPFSHGVPLTRWMQSLHCMIQKDPLPKITRLRIVQLYEADFNSMLKYVLGRKLMHHSEEHRINSPQLYGSRKGKSTQEALITLRVIYDLARLDRCHMVSLFNDLKGCYD